MPIHARAHLKLLLWGLTKALLTKIQIMKGPRKIFLNLPNGGPTLFMFSFLVHLFFWRGRIVAIVNEPKMKYCGFSWKLCSVLPVLHFLPIFLKVSKAEYSFHDDGDNSSHSQLVRYNSNRNSNTLQCALSCKDGSKCSNQNCRGCEWNCGGKCTSSSIENCGLTCNPNSCGRKVCKGCLMCLDRIESNHKSCPIATFKDKTSVKFASAPYYWQQWTHSGRPYLHDGAPVFFDLNGDGVMDY